MTTISAVYEHGVFRPTQPVELPDGARVEVVVPESAAAPLGSPMEMLTEIAALPMESGGRQFDGRDHDAVLYGDRGRL